MLILLGLWFDLTLWRVMSNATETRLAQADVILVLGCGPLRSGAPGVCQTTRTSRAVELWKAGYAPNLIFSGGQTATTVEAENMATLARNSGVPPDAIVLENQATSTVENLRYSKKLMAERSWRSVILVTEPFHLYRARKMAADEGLELVGYAPATSSTNWSGTGARAYNVLRDTFSLMVYESFGGLVYT